MAPDVSFILYLFTQKYKKLTLWPLFILSIVYATSLSLICDNFNWILNREGALPCSMPVKLNFLSQLILIFNFQANKMVYFGKLNGTDVVIKVYSYNDADNGSDTNLDWRKKLKESLSFSVNDQFVKSFIACPSTHKLDPLLDLSSIELANIGIEVVVEPFLLEVLKSSEGWPVPALLGTCGAVLVEEYVGETLSLVKIDSWEMRMAIAIQLLNMAEAFTFSHPTFAFYFTDISPDNIALRENMEAVLIDLDNVIMVDRRLRTKEKLSSWDDLHVSEVFEESDTFIFSTDDICRHSLSDHNYYAVCEHILRRSSILGQGLLAEIPSSPDNDYSDLKMLIQECAKPNEISTRFSAGRQLRHQLESILE